MRRQLERETRPDHRKRSAADERPQRDALDQRPRADAAEGLAVQARPDQEEGRGQAGFRGAVEQTPSSNSLGSVGIDRRGQHE